MYVKGWLRGLDLNQRPSGYEPDELPDCSTPREVMSDWFWVVLLGFACVEDRHFGFARPGSDLLSRALRRSTIGAEGFHGRVRNGIGWVVPRHCHQVMQARKPVALCGLLGRAESVIDLGRMPRLYFVFWPCFCRCTQRRERSSQSSN